MSKNQNNRFPRETVILFRTCLRFYDSSYRASTCASSAVNAGTSVDLELAAGIADAAYGTFRLASAATDAIVFDCVCQSKHLLFQFVLIITE